MDTNEHETIPEKEGVSDWSDTGGQIRRISIFRRILALFVGVLLPIAAFGFGILFKPDWQSKTMESYMAMLLTPWATWPFWPIMFYSMVCLVLTLFVKTASKVFAIRVGLYLGTVWSFQYMMFLLPLGMARDFFPLWVVVYGIAVTVVPMSIPYLFKKLSPKIRRIIIYCLIVLFLAGLLVCTIWHGLDFLMPVWVFPAIASLFASPYWCFTVYLLMSLYVYRRSSEAKLFVALKYKILSGTCFILLYAGAWWLSIQSMLAEYAKLPTEPPDCYIATAAAKGHRRFVKSEDVVLADGRVMRVNSQLRCLKCGELMIKAMFPRIHKLIRLIYDSVGPFLARGLVWPVLADITYILLKPAEWVVVGVLIVLFGKKWDIAGKFYRND